MPQVSDIPTIIVNAKTSVEPTRAIVPCGMVLGMAAPPATLGQRVRELRKRTRRLSADTVADAVGLSRSHLSMIENDQDLPGRETLAAIAAYFRVSVDYVLHGSDAPPQPPNSSEIVNDPDELALLIFWRSLDEADKRVMLKMLGFPPPK